MARAEGASFAPTPIDDASVNRTLREADVRLDAAGQLAGRVKVSWSGQAEIDARLRWNGRDQTGRVLPGGVYLIELKSVGRTRVEKAILIR